MNKPQTVAVWPAYAVPTTTIEKTPYKFLADNAGWLPRAAWGLLKWLGALEAYEHKVTTWTFLPSSQDNVCAAMVEALERSNGVDSAVFIIGSTTFAELAHSPVFREHMTFTVPMQMRKDPYYGRRLYDVPIHVVPGMVGMALVPRVLIETTE